MPRNNQDIGFDESYYEGDSLDIVVTVEEDGSAKDLSGASASWAMSPTPGDTVELSSSDSGVSVSITDEAAGEITVSISEATTEGLVGSWYHEVRVTDSAGDKSVVTTGRMAIEERVSA